MLNLDAELKRIDQETGIRWTAKCRALKDALRAMAAERDEVVARMAAMDNGQWTTKKFNHKERKEHRERNT